MEQASLVLQLLCTLTGLDIHMAHSAPQFKAAVYLMTLRLGVASSRSPVPAVASILDSQVSEEASTKIAELVGRGSKAFAEEMQNMEGLEGTRLRPSSQLSPSLLTT